VKFVSDQPFTCGSFAPPRTLGGVEEEEWFATGDTRGNIRLWHGLATAFRQLEVAGDGDTQKAFPETEKRLPTTSLHWHAHAVGALAFTPSGAQLLSVGEESVLVQWHLASGKREFIPRLGGKPIVSLAVKAGLRGVEEEWWMSLSDGGLVHVGAGSGVIKSVGQGVRLGMSNPLPELILRSFAPQVDLPLPITPTPSHPRPNPTLVTFFDPPVHRYAITLSLV
jgi:NET1-associated nuclear protein 1 (U3 small nucleolar RNA-associated protein 17)